MMSFDAFLIDPFTADSIKALNLAYWSSPLLLIFDIHALWSSGLSARAAKYQKAKIMGLTSMALNPSNRQFGITRVEGVKHFGTDLKSFIIYQCRN